MISDLSFCNQVRQKMSHSFRFKDSYDPLYYKFYLQDIEEQNLRLKTERIEPPVETCTEDIKTLIETRCPINCLEFQSTDIIFILSIESHSETEESLEDSFDKEVRSDKPHTAEKHSSDSRSDVSITFKTSLTEKMREPIDKNLHIHFELITEPSNPADETKSKGDTIAEEDFNDTEIEDADQRRQSNLQENSLLDKKESTLNLAVDCSEMVNHGELEQENEYKRVYS